MRNGTKLLSVTSVRLVRKKYRLLFFQINFRGVHSFYNFIYQVLFYTFLKHKNLRFQTDFTDFTDSWFLNYLFSGKIIQMFDQMNM